MANESKQYTLVENGSGSNNIGWFSLAQGLGAIGAAYGQASSQELQYQYQAQVSEQNSRLANIKAEDSIRRGGKEADQIKNQIKKVIGTQRSGFAAQNIDVDYGVATDIQAETAAMGAEAAQTVQNNAWREAWGYKVEAVNQQGSAAFARSAGENAYGNTILSGGLQAVNYGASAYYATNAKTKDKVD